MARPFATLLLPFAATCLLLPAAALAVDPAHPAAAPEAQAAAALVAPAAAPPAAPANQTAAPWPSASLQVQLAVKKPLRLARFTIGKDKGAVALDGHLEVTLANTDPARRVLLAPQHEVHGFVFRPKAGGAPVVLIHSCRCVKDFADKVPDVLVLQPGERKVTTYDDWGCSGSMWTPPPPGTYLVAYRTLVFDQAHPARPPQKPSRDAAIPALVDLCRARLSDDASWGGAAVSNEIEVALGAVTELRLDRKGERWLEKPTQAKKPRAR